MEMPVNVFKRKIKSADIPYGTWLSASSASTAEALGCAGLRFPRRRHGALADRLSAGGRNPARDRRHARVGRHARAVERHGDGQARARCRRADADVAVDPERRRGARAPSPTRAIRPTACAASPACSVRAATAWSTDYARHAAGELCVIVQIETADALAQLPRIVEVPGVDSIFIGPSDLAASMGHLGDILHADVQRSLEQAAQACRRLGVPCGCLGAESRDDAALPRLRLFVDGDGFGHRHAGLASARSGWRRSPICRRAGRRPRRRRRPRAHIETGEPAAIASTERRAAMTLRVELAAGAAHVLLLPQIGGAIGGFTWRGADVMRAMPADAIAGGNVRLAAAYPLVPYSNRIRDAVLTVGGERYPLRRNFGDSPHAIHGVGWQRAWTRRARRCDPRALLVLDARHRRRRATCRGRGRSRRRSRSCCGITVRMRRSTATLTLQNTGVRTFPFGLGWHPFLPQARGDDAAVRRRRTCGTTTRRSCRSSADAGAAAVELHADAAIGDASLDNVFTGWRGVARLASPDTALRDDDRSRFGVRMPRRLRAAAAATSSPRAGHARNRRVQPQRGGRIGDGHAAGCRPARRFSCTMRISAAHSARIMIDSNADRVAFRVRARHPRSLGESPVWCVDEQVLYFVDINAPSLNRFDPATGRNVAMPMPSSIGCFALRQRGGFVVALRDGIWLADRNGALAAEGRRTRPTTRRTIASTTAAATCRAASSSAR